MKYAWLILLSTCITASAQLDVRHLYVTNDISDAVSFVAPLKWAKGESVKWDLHLKRGGVAVDLTATNLTCVLQVFSGATQMQYAIGNINTNGSVTFDLEPSALPVADYDVYVSINDLSGATNRLCGIVWRSKLQVGYGPESP